jgi:hypothetical protein
MAIASVTISVSGSRGMRSKTMQFRLMRYTAVVAILAWCVSALAVDPAPEPAKPVPEAAANDAAADAKDASASAAEAAPGDADDSGADAVNDTAPTDTAAAPRKPATAKGSPQHFEPTEKVRPDFDVAFPVDI